LRNARRDGEGEMILSEAAACCHVGAKSAGDRMRLAAQIQVEAVAEEWNRDGVVEDGRPIDCLMDSAPQCHAESSFADAAGLHELECKRQGARGQEGTGRGDEVTSGQRGEGARFRSHPKRAMCVHDGATRTSARMLMGMAWSNSWIGWALLSAVFAAATALLAKVGVAHVDSNLATALRTSVVVVFAWGIALALGKHGEIRSLDRRTLLFLGLSGLATGLSWLCYFRALQLGPASRVAPLDKLSVPLVMVFAWLTLGEKLDAAAIAGGLLITAGAAVMAMG
jgi:bacterial/archaeal transporter family protein